MTLSKLHDLLNLLTNAVTQLEEACTENGTSVPDLDKPSDTTSEDFRKDPTAALAADVIGAAALHIYAIINPPQISLFDIASGTEKAAALRICLESGVAEILQEAGPQVWREKDPDALESGRVSFEAQDFFEPQPQRDVSFFFLKQILHDWPDEYCIKILTQLRKAASPNTKLLSMDTVVQHACRDNSDLADVIIGAMPDEAPSPLLANWGAVNPMAYCIDMIMLSLFNSRERALSDSVSLFEKSGWKVIEFYKMTLSKLRDLLGLLTDAVTQLEEVCNKNGTSIPDLDAPFEISSEAFREDPTATLAANIIGAAALHIYAIVNPPQFSLFEISSGTGKAAALRVCLDSNVAEILREAGPQGLHINDIVIRNGQDPAKLGGCLRYLATQYIFKEVTPNVFSNNRISSLLDTKKSVQELLANPEQKHENTPGVAALLGFQLDEVSKALAYLWEIFSNTNTVKSNEPSESAFAKFVGGGRTLYEYFDDPEQDFRSRRFNIGMHGSQRFQSADFLLSVYDWKTMAPGSVLVDVGGGVGTAQLRLAREYPNLKIIIQDLPHVVKDGVKATHDFFEPQPQRDVSFFFLKHILHNWPDKYCTKILTQLRQAASPTTKLLSTDFVIQHACHDEGSLIDSIPGAIPDEAPSPLLANWGRANSMSYQVDMIMLACFNSRERTVRDSISLFEKSGWKLTELLEPRTQNIELAATVSRIQENILWEYLLRRPEGDPEQDYIFPILVREPSVTPSSVFVAVFQVILTNQRKLSEMTLAKLRDLLGLLTNAVAQLEEACARNDTSIPDLDAPFTLQSDAFREDRTADEATNIIGAAALHMWAIVNSPYSALQECSSKAITKSAALHGLHINKIAKQNGQDASKLGRCLRYMATHHVFREVSPDIFSNNRISSLLDTGKSAQELFTNLDEGFKALANVWEICSDPITVKSCEPSHSAFTKFNMVMQGSLKLHPADAMLSIYNWKKVPAGSVIVDVGGGIGTSQLCLAREFPYLKIIIQDLSPVVEEGFKVLHDWSDDNCSKMLTQLRKAASPTTKLLSMDTIIPHACHDENSFITTIPGAAPDEAPSPLLANWGGVNAEGYCHDIVMLSMFNSKERTLVECINLFEQSGWKLVEVHRQKGAQGSYLACLEATPI
ncbi:hypothetical protein Clacol_000843 [Clathrus columnatus]|uniref:O-methyltransferase C-terminal domain-containing protein n=1 Tax=Clathrus columnatus TaxID=1419009 RepID=A0AAV5A043_9AGAM|nr:hypothetical protein Clacol_000843 [Clathrus columnatus]